MDLSILFFLAFQESKRTFIHNAINEGGDKEKLEFFVDFCEDTIFEVNIDLFHGRRHHQNYVPKSQA
jgi:hypothetical protein